MQRKGHLFAGALALGWLAHPAAADLIIQEIVDGTVNSQPKWVELVNTGTECLFLGDFELCNYNNGSLVASSCSGLGDVFLAPGASYVFAYEPASNTACSPTMTCFEVIYGFAPNQHGGAFSRTQCSMPRLPPGVPNPVNLLDLRAECDVAWLPIPPPAATEGGS